MPAHPPKYSNTRFLSLASVTKYCCFPPFFGWLLTFVFSLFAIHSLWCQTDWAHPSKESSSFSLTVHKPSNLLVLLLYILENVRLAYENYKPISSRHKIQKRILTNSWCFQTDQAPPIFFSKRAPPLAQTIRYFDYAPLYSWLLTFIFSLFTIHSLPFKTNWASPTFSAPYFHKLSWSWKNWLLTI